MGKGTETEEGTETQREWHRKGRRPREQRSRERQTGGKGQRPKERGDDLEKIDRGGEKEIQGEAKTGIGKWGDTAFSCGTPRL